VVEALADVVRIVFQDLYGKQRAAFFGSARISLCEASTKAGKSVGGLTWLCHQGMNVAPGHALLWLAPVYAQARVMFNRLVRWLSKMDSGHDTGWDANRTEMFVTLPGGSKIFFKGSDNPDTIYGSDYAAVVIDEASRCLEEAFHAVRSTTTATRGPIRAIGNVKGRKNWFYRMCRKAEAGEPDMEYHKIIAADAVAAGVIDADEVADAKRHLPEAVFRELYLAQASDDEGNPFGLVAIRARIGSMATGDPVVWGWDLAKSVDWTVGIGLDAGGSVCRFERFQHPWQETFDRIVSATDAPSALVDSTGVGDPILEALQRRNGGTYEGFKFTSGSKQQLMEGLAVGIQQGHLTYRSSQSLKPLNTSTPERV
jgi:hypothetical protein